MSQIHFLRMLLHNLHSAHDVPSYLLHPDSSKKLLVRKLSLQGSTLNIFRHFLEDRERKREYQNLTGPALHVWFGEN